MIEDKVETHPQDYAEAMNVAVNVHWNQLRWNGEPYLLHPIRVSQKQETLMGKVIGLLHDVIEDSPDDEFEENLRNRIPLIFGNRVYKAVDALTKREGESYQEYVERVAENPDAIPVKLADLEDNMDILGTGKDELDKKHQERLAKYLKAYRYLEDELRAIYNPIYRIERDADQLDETQKEHIRRGYDPFGGGYQPEDSGTNPENPPKGGSGVERYPISNDH